MWACLLVCLLIVDVTLSETVVGINEPGTLFYEHDLITIGYHQGEYLNKKLTYDEITNHFRVVENDYVLSEYSKTIDESVYDLYYEYRNSLGCMNLLYHQRYEYTDYTLRLFEFLQNFKRFVALNFVPMHFNETPFFWKEFGNQRFLEDITRALSNLGIMLTSKMSNYYRMLNLMEVSSGMNMRFKHNDVKAMLNFHAFSTISKTQFYDFYGNLKKGNYNPFPEKSYDNEIIDEPRKLTWKLALAAIQEFYLLSFKLFYNPYDKKFEFLTRNEITELQNELPYTLFKPYRLHYERFNDSLKILNSNYEIDGFLFKKHWTCECFSTIHTEVSYDFDVNFPKLNNDYEYLDPSNYSSILKFPQFETCESDDYWLDPRSVEVAYNRRIHVSGIVVSYLYMKQLTKQGFYIQRGKAVHKDVWYYWDFPSNKGVVIYGKCPSTWNINAPMLCKNGTVWVLRYKNRIFERPRVDITVLISALSGVRVNTNIDTVPKGETNLLYRDEVYNYRIIRVSDAQLKTYMYEMRHKSYRDWKIPPLFLNPSTINHTVKLITILYEGSFDSNILNADKFILLIQITRDYYNIIDGSGELSGLLNGYYKTPFYDDYFIDSNDFYDWELHDVLSDRRFGKVDNRATNDKTILRRLNQLEKRVDQINMTDFKDILMHNITVVQNAVNKLGVKTQSLELLFNKTVTNLNIKVNEVDEHEMELEKEFVSISQDVGNFREFFNDSLDEVKENITKNILDLETVGETMRFIYTSIVKVNNTVNDMEFDQFEKDVFNNYSVINKGLNETMLYYKNLAGKFEVLNDSVIKLNEEVLLIKELIESSNSTFGNGTDFKKFNKTLSLIQDKLHLHDNSIHDTGILINKVNTDLIGLIQASAATTEKEFKSLLNIESSKINDLKLTDVGHESKLNNYYALLQLLSKSDSLFESDLKQLADKVDDFKLHVNDRFISFNDSIYEMIMVQYNDVLNQVSKAVNDILFMNNTLSSLSTNQTILSHNVMMMNETLIIMSSAISKIQVDLSNITGFVNDHSYKLISFENKLSELMKNDVQMFERINTLGNFSLMINEGLSNLSSDFGALEMRVNDTFNFYDMNFKILNQTMLDINNDLIMSNETIWKQLDIISSDNVTVFEKIEALEDLNVKMIEKLNMLEVEVSEHNKDVNNTIYNIKNNINNINNTLFEAIEIFTYNISYLEEKGGESSPNIIQEIKDKLQILNETDAKMRQELVDNEKFVRNVIDKGFHNITTNFTAILKIHEELSNKNYNDIRSINSSQIAYKEYIDDEVKKLVVFYEKFKNTFTEENIANIIRILNTTNGTIDSDELTKGFTSMINRLIMSCKSHRSIKLFEIPTVGKFKGFAFAFINGEGSIVSSKVDHDSFSVGTKPLFGIDNWTMNFKGEFNNLFYVCIIASKADPEHLIYLHGVEKLFNGAYELIYAKVNPNFSVELSGLLYATSFGHLVV